MFLAFKLSNIVTVPFGWLMGWLYQVTGNYGVAMILFAVCVQMALLPISQPKGTVIRSRSLNAKNMVFPPNVVGNTSVFGSYPAHRT